MDEIMSFNVEVEQEFQENFSKYFAYLSDAKSTIQREILPLTSSEEKDDILRGKINMRLVNKLIHLGGMYYANSAEKSNVVLYCIAVAVGTIIKEYDWGTQYLTRSSIFQLASMFVSASNAKHWLSE